VASDVNLSDPKTLLSVLEIILIIIVGIYVFAVQEQKVEYHGTELKRQEAIIEDNRIRTNRLQLENAVTQEQYKQIMKKLSEIDKKLD
jgi:hypothetical protein